MFSALVSKTWFSSATAFFDIGPGIAVLTEGPAGSSLKNEVCGGESYCTCAAATAAVRDSVALAYDRTVVRRGAQIRVNGRIVRAARSTEAMMMVVLCLRKGRITSTVLQELTTGHAPHLMVTAVLYTSKSCQKPFLNANRKAVSHHGFQRKRRRRPRPRPTTGTLSPLSSIRLHLTKLRVV